VPRFDDRALVECFEQTYQKGEQDPSRVNVNIDVRMASADTQIRVSEKVKKMLERRKREGESYNDVVERVLGENTEPDFYDGFGRWSGEQATRVREERRKGQKKRKERTQSSLKSSE
jgi:predicted CopG family antitoxin